MIDNRQKFLIHHYARAAGLSGPAYRALVRKHSGVSSAADQAMSQSAFDRIMAALETVLMDRAARHLVPDPVGCDRWIRSRDYWRRKLPRAGCVNSRQAHRIQELWSLLSPLLPVEDRTTDYLARIIHQATGRAVFGVSALTAHDAGCLLDALTDRLAHAVRAPAETEVACQAP